VHAIGKPRVGHCRSQECHYDGVRGGDIQEYVQHRGPSLARRTEASVLLQTGKRGSHCSGKQVPANRSYLYPRICKYWVCSEGRLSVSIDKERFHFNRVEHLFSYQARTLARIKYQIDGSATCATTLWVSRRRCCTKRALTLHPLKSAPSSRPAPGNTTPRNVHWGELDVAVK
jgi:hypothetical protein